MEKIRNFLFRIRQHRPDILRCRPSDWRMDGEKRQDTYLWWCQPRTHGNAVAKSSQRNGGHVIGVVPSKLEENGKVSTYPDEIIATHDLSDRKDIILQQSDVLVALPGGIGTLDEVFHVMAAASIGYHQKKVIFYNADGFYNPLARRAQRITDKRIHPSPSVLLL